MRKFITGGDFKKMVINAAAAIEIKKQPINELNVFPVPDGDTGTNMSLTIGAGAAELKKKDFTGIGDASGVVASALLRGARGNSGVILSLLFRGMSKSLRGKSEATASDLAEAMINGVETAYNAVMKPAEGTILTVSRLASGAAFKLAEEEEDIEKVLEGAIAVGYEALDNTINQNPVLQKAGVVDAGGKGYLIILEGMLNALKGNMIDLSEAEGQIKEKADFSDFDTEDITFAYCTEFIVNRENEKNPQLLKDFLGRLGDSIVVVDDEEIIKTHVHTNQPGVVLTEALTYGSLLTVKIENMRQQHTAKVVDEEAAKEAVSNAIAAPEKKYGIVAVCAGSGMAQAFIDLTADGTITGGQTMNPSTEDILKQVNATPAEIVYVLPNNKNIIMAAQQCVGLTEKKVIVIPSKTMPQGIAAIMNFDPTASEEENTQAMTAALAGVHTAQVTYAARNSEFDGHSIKSGDYLAMLENSMLSSGADFDDIISSVIDSFEDFEPEFINIYYGEDTDEDSAMEVCSKFEAAFPDAEITAICGGQPVYCYLISAE